jgi:PAS domain S-box-containing protein
MSRRRRLFPGKRRASKGGDRTDPRIFATRHRFLLVLLLAQVPVLAVVGLTQASPASEVVAGSLVLLAASVCGLVARSQMVGAGVVTLGLVTAAGILVRYLEGSPASFFAFYLALVAVSFYRETGLLVVGLVYVAGFHVFSLLSLYRESIIFRSGVMEMPLPIAAVVLDLLLVLLLIAGWRMTARAETRRLAAADMFRMGFDRSSIGMAILTPSGEFIHANETLTSYVGTVTAANVRSVVHTDDLDLLGRLWEDMGQSEQRSSETWLRLRCADGLALWGKVSLSFMRGVRNRPAAILLQFEDDGEGQRDQTRLEAQIAGRDLFVAAIAEDIKGSMRSVLDLTAQAAGDPVDLQRVVHRIEDETKQVASVVDDLLVSASAKSVPHVARSVDAALLCREALADVPGAGDVLVEADAEQVWADPGLTIRILDNLVANAVRYGGRVVNLEVMASGPDTVISVIDDGAAVPIPEREHMFEADLRSGSQPTRPATVGLSLTVARRLARQMDGDITYRRTGDGHNVFELRLPAEPLHLTLDTVVGALGIPA